MAIDELEISIFYLFRFVFSLVQLLLRSNHPFSKQQFEVLPRPVLIHYHYRYRYPHQIFVAKINLKFSKYECNSGILV